MSLSCVCFNHEDREAKFNCFDCKADFVVKYCHDCHDKIHTMEVFRGHRCTSIEKLDQRRLSQDISNIERLVEVETTILKDVITTLRETEQQEMNAIHDFLGQAHKRLDKIQQCSRNVDKAVFYLSKVSDVVSHLPYEPGSCTATTDIPDTASAISDTRSESTSHQTECPEMQINLDSIDFSIPAPGDEIPVTVKCSLAKNGTFWMARKESSEKVFLLEKALREFFEVNETCAVTAVEETMVFAAHVQDRQAVWNYWRVKVEKKINQTMVKVRYMDHGMVQDLPLQSLVELPAQFKEIPYQAMECCLFANFLEVSLPYEAKWCFRDLTHGKDLLAKMQAKIVTAPDKTTHYVHLISQSDSAVNINSMVHKVVEENKLKEEDRPIRPKEEIAKAPIVADVSQNDSTTNLQTKDATQGVTTTTVESRNNASESNSTAVQPPPLMNGQVTILKPEQSSNVPVSSSIPENEKTCKPAGPPEFVPVGMMTERMRSTVIDKCSANRSTLNSKIYSAARYMVIRSEPRQLVEAIKQDKWCVFSEFQINTLNQYYYKRPLILIFTDHSYVDGLAEMASAATFNSPRCTVVSPGMYWHQRCHGEFALKWHYVRGIPFHWLKDERTFQYARSYQELDWMKGKEVVKSFTRDQRGRHKSIMDSAVTQYMENVERPRKLSCDDLPDVKGFQKEPIIHQDWDLSNVSVSSEGHQVEACNDDLVRESNVSTEVNPAPDAISVSESIGLISAENAPGKLAHKGPRTEPCDTPKEAPYEEAIASENAPKETTVAPITEDHSEKPKTRVTDQSKTLEKQITEDVREGQSTELCSAPLEIKALPKVDVPSMGMEVDRNMKDVLDSCISEKTIQGIPSETTKPESLSEIAMQDTQTKKAVQDTQTKKAVQDIQAENKVQEIQPEKAVTDIKAGEAVQDIQTEKAFQDIQTEKAFQDIQTENAVQYIPLQVEAPDKGKTNKESFSSNIDQSSELHFTDDWESDIGKLSQASQQDVNPTDNRDLTSDQEESGSDPPSRESPAHFYYPSVPEELPDLSEDSTSAGYRHKHGEYTTTSHEDIRAPAEGTAPKSSSAFGGSVEDIAGEDFLPVDPGCYYSVALRCPINSQRIFWASLKRTNQQNEEYNQFLSNLKSYMEAKGESLTNPFLLKSCCVRSDTKGRVRYRRGLIVEIPSNDKFLVRLTDEGPIKRYHKSVIFELPDRFTVEYPPQALQCRLDANAKGVERFKSQFRRDKKVTIYVVSISGEIVNVKIHDFPS
ncbi:uncharacterized protein LOC5517765 isoform X2 [Nematostella vectensis]|uniref:uncharacterized protein LOC5517765 isoform X2 n=1 Tax=Nematostella vectensis TaxID=45351 RepID=UPI002077356B|nr:uncharacterized protein LOC5517765 isoform X2 [Nematostella vectensis]